MIDKNSTKAEVVKNDWEALKYASEELRNDKEVVLAAMWRNWEALRYAGAALLRSAFLKI
jgi:hypothetical protein